MNMLVNALSERIIFTFWTGKNKMSQNRKRCFQSIVANSGCKVCLITPNNLNDWIVKGKPLHPGYSYLSNVFKSDYLRAYFMYHYGGGYTDIKYISFDWRPYFKLLEESDDLWCIGYKEIGPEGVAGPREEKEILKKNWEKLIGNCAYIFKPKTKLAEEWLGRVHQVLDMKFQDLIKYPANHPFDYFGRPYYPKNFEGLIRWIAKRPKYSRFPIRWAEICGEIFHPLVFKYQHYVSQSLPKPDFNVSYR